jgi:hypothetical protein
VLLLHYSSMKQHLHTLYSVPSKCQRAPCRQDTTARPPCPLLPNHPTFQSTQCRVRDDQTLLSKKATYWLNSARLLSSPETQMSFPTAVVRMHATTTPPIPFCDAPFGLRRQSPTALRSIESGSTCTPPQRGRSHLINPSTGIPHSAAVTSRHHSLHPQTRNGRAAPPLPPS